MEFLTFPGRKILNLNSSWLVLFRFSITTVIARRAKPDVAISRYDVLTCILFRWMVPGVCHGPLGLAMSG